MDELEMREAQVVTLVVSDNSKSRKSESMLVAFIENFFKYNLDPVKFVNS